MTGGITTWVFLCVWVCRLLNSVPHLRPQLWQGSRGRPLLIPVPEPSLKAWTLSRIWSESTLQEFQNNRCIFIDFFSECNDCFFFYSKENKYLLETV